MDDIDKRLSIDTIATVLLAGMPAEPAQLTPEQRVVEVLKKVSARYREMLSSFGMPTKENNNDF